MAAGSPVAGIPVTLHRVTREASGPVASVATRADGRFHFRLPPPAREGFSVYFTTAEYRGIRYFGPPVHEGSPPAAYRVTVYDTTSAVGDSLVTARRDVVLVPGNDGSWEVNEVVRVRNRAGRTVVPGADGRAWELPLPARAADFEAGDGDLASREVRLVGDRVLVVGPLVPGDHELFIRYRLPAGLSGAALPLGGPTDTLNVYVRQPVPSFTVEGLTSTRTVTVEGERFVQYGATAVEGGRVVSLAWSAGGAAAVGPVAAGLGAAVLVLVVGTGAAVRRRLSGPAELPPRLG